MEFDFFGTELYISPAALAMAALFYYMTNPISVFFVLISILIHEDGHLFAVKMFKEGKIQDAFTAEPEYLRAAEAERKLKDGSLKPQPTANTVE